MYASDLKHDNQSLENKLHKLYRLNRDKTIDLGFRPPFLNLLEALGNPHLNLPPVIHVAGTNGKGSTIAFMRTMLEAAGYRVHTYTSPHLVRFNERIVLAGQEIGNDLLESLVDEAIEANNDGDVTFFEITTAIAFAAFSRVPADIVLLEVGLGGRLDCTNIIETAAVSVINSISMDHMEFLGETLPEIAAEKAGIMKPHVPCVIGAQDAHIWPTFMKTAQDKDVTLFRNGSDWFIKDQGVHICFESGSVTHILPKPALCGTHQIRNAGLAIAALKTLQDHSEFTITEDHMAAGLQNAKWPARLQRLNDPTADWELWLDGGHNEDAGKALAAQAAQWQDTASKPLHLVVAMMAHKNPNTFLAPLLPHISSIHVIDIPGEPDSLQAADLIKKIATENTPPVAQAENLARAIDSITSQNQSPGRILVAGSLYLAGHILKHQP